MNLSSSKSRKIVVMVAGLSCLSAWPVADCYALDVVAIEEHWELHVGGPEPDRAAPQIAMVMSPTVSLDSDFFIFNLNHWSYPDYSAGGLEVQHWDGEEWQSSHHGPSIESLHHDNETVSWSQRLSLNDGSLTFEVRDGSSQSWGAFGGQGYLKHTQSSSLTRLNDYQPAISIGESGISYAGNRVSSLVLKKLVWWTEDGQMHELFAPIDIDTDLDP